MNLQELKIVGGDGVARHIPQYLDNKVDEAIKRLFVGFTEDDVATIEFLHDRLLEVYDNNLNADYMIRARGLIKKIRTRIK